ncbi:MAG: hypothetical protein M3281_08025 [Chloroflexota bacterium]|nr:hypothetical protein [Chloroflexota bacterium]
MGQPTAATPPASRRLTQLSSLPLLVFGLFLFALGIVLTLHSGLGLGPWDVLHQGLSEQIGLTFGQTSILVGGVLVVLTVLLGERPGLGTVLNMLLIGLFIDLIRSTGLVPYAVSHGFALRLGMDCAGVGTVGVGSALYIKAGFGAGPRDSLMLALRRLTGVRVGVARTCIEVTALVTGYLLGGTVGLGTAVFALGIGPAVDLAFRAFNVHAHTSRPEPSATARRTAARGSPRSGGGPHAAGTAPGDD